MTPTDEQLDAIRKTVREACKDLTGGGNQRAIMYQHALIRAAYAAGAASVPREPTMKPCGDCGETSWICEEWKCAMCGAWTTDAYGYDAATGVTK